MRVPVVSWVRPLLARWLAFTIVGSTGILVQLASLSWLLIAGLDYLAATALAVEAAVLNNFFWHERWTWGDRTSPTSRDRIARLVRFNLTVGLISIAANLLLMGVLVGQFSLPPITGNLFVIALAGIANFLLSETYVFRPASGK